MKNQIFEISNKSNILLKANLIKISSKNELYFFNIFSENNNDKFKKSTLNILLVLNNEIITFNFFDTIQAVEEIALFELGNEHNKYFKIVELKSVKNLKLMNKSHVFISKSEAKAIVKTFNLLFSNYSFNFIFESEFNIDQKEFIKLINERKELLELMNLPKIK
ncbi:hypothetical protein [Aliarcobacter skirrowii]|uniref:hypothetical protein n=1 Tax=Aliarcobacter skirrowii TaxID=28200 RepID=UPI0029AF2183|nr:hypothetical protein [Aliarcobacter skirrowii]MDX4037713.1 hypothetical protein [Aliarcobacter skirrowii]